MIEQAPVANSKTFDAAVVGVGPMGLTTGLLLARNGFSVAVIGPDISSAETRTTALLQGTVNLLSNIGVWDGLSEASEPLAVMRIIDDTKRLIRAPEVAFRAEEIGNDAFGYNVPVAHLIDVLRRTAQANERLTLIDGTVDTLDDNGETVRIALASGALVEARVAIGADGRNSVCRAAARIGVNEQAYPQSALALNLRHTRPHDNVSTEFHRENGPMVLVPLPGLHSSIVLVDNPDRIAALLDMPDEALGAEITRLSHGILGKITVDGPSRGYPLVRMTAKELAKGRIALVGEAAHVMPPIGAQGLNLGIRDAAVLAEKLSTPDTVHNSADRALSAYQRARRTDIGTRIAAVDLLNRSLLSGFLGLQGARALGLYAIKGVGPLRRLMMREGMEPSLASASILRAP